MTNGGSLRRRNMFEEYTNGNLPNLKEMVAKNYSEIDPASEPEVKGVGILTSGGDAPGMNATIRAVVRAGTKAGFKMMGVTRGYHGLWKGEVKELGHRDVSETLQRGGTFLMTARSKSFETPAGVLQGAKMCKVFGIDCLVVVGGDGSFKGARDLARIGIPVIGIPGTIDNDAASSHERCSVIEVMGRHAGYIALNVGIATGAEIILLPEVPWDMKDVIKTILDCRNKGKRHYIVIVAEGAGDATEIAKQIEEATEIESRPTILGHLQRGGSPSLRDRTMASLMGVRAIECIKDKRLNRLVVYRNGEITDVDIEEGLSMKKSISMDELERSKLLT